MGEQVKVTKNSKANKSKKIKFHCKPCYNFQSIEFDIECEEDDIGKMFDLYELIVTRLIYISPEQPEQAAKRMKAEGKSFSKPIRKGTSKSSANDYITEGQKKWLDSYNIPYTDTMTKKEASKYIDKIQAGEIQK